MTVSRVVQWDGAALATALGARPLPGSSQTTQTSWPFLQRPTANPQEHGPAWAQSGSNTVCEMPEDFTAMTPRWGLKTMGIRHLGGSEG